VSNIRLKIAEGQKFGRLTALRDIGSDKRGRLQECLCDCGQFVVVPAGHLGKATNSCGCLHSDITSKMFSLPTGEANFNHVFRCYKRKARERNFEFLLTKEQFKELTQQNCFYCGIKPHNLGDEPNCNGKFIYSGIDRIDNTKGYVVDNCVPCCGTCNWMKRDHTRQEFLMKIKLIYENLLRGRNG